MSVLHVIFSTESLSLNITSSVVIVSIQSSHRSILIPSYFNMFAKNELRLVLSNTLFMHCDESEEHLFMDTSTTYGADLYVESLVTSLVEGDICWHIFKQLSSRFPSCSILPTIAGHLHQPNVPLNVPLNRSFCSPVSGHPLLKVR